MIRFFRKSSPSGAATAEMASEAPLQERGDARTTADGEPAEGPEAERQIDFELRKPTEEELIASIMSEQDFVDIARILPSSRPRGVSEKAQPPGSGAETPSARPVASEPTPSAQADPPPATAATEPGEHDAEPLIGFWDGLTVGKFLTGWAGDPHDPTCRTIKVALCVDGKELTSVHANVPRSDVEHGGFEIRVADPSIARLLLQDRVIIRASRDGRRATDLMVLPQVIDMARDFRAREIERAGQGAGPTAPVPRSIEELGPILLPIGLSSPNSAAILGKDGYLFAYRGPFDVVGQYAVADSEMIEIDADAWCDLFESRRAVLGGRNIAYMQSIQPEKATILAALAPPGFANITPRLGLIEARLADQNRSSDAAGYYRSLIAPLRSCHEGGISPYLRLSDGYRVLGAQLSFYQLLAGIAVNMPDRFAEFDEISALCRTVVGNTGTQIIGGDLAYQFMVPMYEAEAIPDFGAVASYDVQPAAREQLDADVTYRRWHNPEAPSRLKVMLVGSTCFGDGELARSTSWWFKSMFAEVALVESDDLPFDIVDRDGPDIVLCQTLERKLARIPKS